MVRSSHAIVRCLLLALSIASAAHAQGAPEAPAAAVTEAPPAEAPPSALPTAEAATTLVEEPAPPQPTPEAATQEATGLDARVRRLADALARGIKRLPGDHRAEAWAVLPFAELGPETVNRRLGAVVADLVTTNLVRDHRLALVERGALSDVLDEQALAQLGVTEPARAAEVGKIAEARGVIVGQVQDAGDAFVVTARLLDTTTAEILVADEQRLPKEELIAYSADAVVLRSKSASMFRSVVAPGWGQTYNGEPVKAALVIAGIASLAAFTVGAAGVAVTFHYLYLTWTPNGWPTDEKPTPDAQARTLEGLRTTGTVSYWVAGVFAALTAATWGGQALEAYLSGVDADSIDRARLAE
jgi:TolB-like protein